MNSLELCETPLKELSTKAIVHENADRLRQLERQVAELSRTQTPGREGLTLIVFSGEMDKLMMAFMLANGAAALGMPVFMCFTFWALAALRTGKKVRGKGLLDRLTSAMLPAGPGRLGLSRWNMLGLGRPIMDLVMRRRNAETLESLILVAREMGVRLAACQTAMDVMGLRREELLEGIEFAGVTTMLDAAQSSGTTLVI